MGRNGGMHHGELQWSESSSHVVASAHAPDLPLQQQPSFQHPFLFHFSLSPSQPSPAVAVRQMGNGLASCSPGLVRARRKCWSIRTHMYVVLPP